MIRYNERGGVFNNNTIVSMMLQIFMHMITSNDINRLIQVNLFLFKCLREHHNVVGAKCSYKVLATDFPNTLLHFIMV